MPKNPLVDLAAVAAFAYWGYLLGRMLWRREAYVRDGWTKWTWEPASIYPGSYMYGIFMTSLGMIFSAFLIYADFRGWMR
jgi:hypothetical protein